MSTIAILAWFASALAQLFPPAGKRADFRYPNAMMARATTGLVRNEDAARAYLADPRAFLPGGSKAFAGIKDEQRMADLIAYLRTPK